MRFVINCMVEICLGEYVEYFEVLKIKSGWGFLVVLGLNLLVVVVGIVL